MKVFRDIRWLYWRAFLINLRNPTWLFVGISTPIMYLVLFTPLLKPLAGSGGFPQGHVLDIFLPGILALLSFGSGTGLGFGTLFDLKSGLIERFRVTPASRFALLIGSILASSTWTLFFTAIVVAISTLYGFHVHIVGLLVYAVLLVLLLLLFAAFFTAIALITKEISSLAAISNGLNLPILLLAGVLLPLSAGPGWMRFLGHLDPLYYTVEAGRSLCANHFTTTQVWQGFGVIVPLTILVMAWSTRVYRKAVA
jgi:ABC-2 type transport system permease protein